MNFKIIVKLYCIMFISYIVWNMPHLKKSLKAAFPFLGAIVTGAVSGTHLAFAGALETQLDGDILFAIFINFIGGSILTFICCPSFIAKLYSTRNEDSERIPFRPYMCLTGVSHSLIICLIVLCFSQGGAMLTAIGVTMGIIVGSSFVDHFGLLGIPVRRMTWSKFFCFALLFGGVVISTVGQGDSAEGAKNLYVLSAFAGGFLLSFLRSLSALTAKALPYKVQANVVSFPISTVCIGIVWGIYVAAFGQAEWKYPLWWMYFVGPLEVIVMFGGFFFGPLVGMAPYQIFYTMGNLLVSLMVDSKGYLLAEVIEITWYRIVGAVLTFLACILYGKVAHVQRQKEEKAENVEKDLPRKDSDDSLSTVEGDLAIGESEETIDTSKETSTDQNINTAIDHNIIIDVP